MATQPRDGSAQPPWKVDGLPYGLTEEDFRVAARVVVAGVPEGDVWPLYGLEGAYFHCYGTHYPENAARLDALARVPPLIVDGRGSAIHPAILVPDPSSWAPGTAPLGFAILYGYVGSVYVPDDDELLGKVERRLYTRRRLLATRVAIVRAEGGEWEVKAWLRVDPQWLRELERSRS